ncbi:MAG: ATP-binding cassette domain-containing protein [Gammaproteobacteria bacterium]
MITLRNILLRFGQHVLLENLNWTIYHKQRIGIIGANGSGKTSLFSLLLGQLQPDVGDLEIPRQIKLAHVAQETPAYTKSALEFVLDGDVELRTLQQELSLAEQKNIGDQIALLHARLGEIDAYTAPARAARLLSGLGFNHKEQQQSVSDFSGGWRVRLNLAQALMSRSDVLLLDEPTNHLDLDAVIWLENWLIKYSGTLLLISHDRDFLDRIVDHVAHISHQQLKVYSGNYSSFEKQRADQLLVQQSTFEKQQKYIAHLQSFINRFRYKKTKASQAQSRIKALEKMELISAVQIDSPFQFRFKEPGKCPNPLISLEDVKIAYGDRTILNDVNFSISPKDRIALLGPNGAGKSSLIKLLAGELEPSSGLRQIGEGLKIGYFAQHQVDHLNLDETPLEHMQKLAPQTRELELRTFLGSFGFEGSAVQKVVRNFSGGEKSRLALALIVWKKPNLLLLDEPTNHLDLEMRQALSMALQEYEGAMIIVSHDRFLVRTTVDQLQLVADQQLQEFKGDLDDYERWLIDFRRAGAIDETPQTEVVEVSRKQQRQMDAELRDLRRPLLQEIKKLEVELDRLQKKSTAIEVALTDLAIYEESNKAKLQQYLLDQVAIQKQLQLTESQWLELSEKLEAISTRNCNFP